MPRSLPIVLLLPWLLLAGCRGLLPEVGAGERDYRIIVHLAEPAEATPEAQTLQWLSERAGARLEFTRSLSGGALLLMARGLADESALDILLQRLQGDPRVRSAEADQRRRVQ